MKHAAILLLAFVAAGAEPPRVVVEVGGAKPHAIPLAEGVRFPPGGRAYRDDAESFRLWRKLLLLAPDLVVLHSPDEARLRPALEAAGIPVRVGTAQTRKRVPLSEAHRALLARLRRRPVQVAREMAAFYGRDFTEAVYVPGMAVIARLRLGELDDVEALVAPFVDGSKDSLAKPTASHLAGHLVFAELAQRTGRKEYSNLVSKAAAFAAANPLDNQMSDSVFMVCPLLARAGMYDEALSHFRKMQSLCLRPDGLYRHSPLTEAAWGRGNAFPALGLALSLEQIPRGHAAFNELLRAYRNLIQRLVPMQDSGSGMWHQVIDIPESYGEFSATAMIGRAMLLGVRHGWLDRKLYLPRVMAAWRGVSARTFPDGQVAEVCESTGKQASLKDYLLRESIWGRDARGGGMVMQFALDLAGVP